MVYWNSFVYKNQLNVNKKFILCYLMLIITNTELIFFFEKYKDL